MDSIRPLSPVPATGATGQGDNAQERFHEFYVGIDIGYKAHVAACIPPQAFFDIREPWRKSKTIKFSADSEGIRKLLKGLQQVSSEPKDFMVLMEPTGGHYSYIVATVLISEGYDLYEVDNSAVKDFRERNLGIREKTDEIDARILAYMGYHKALHPSMISVRIVKPAGPNQMLFRTFSRDRWLLNKELTSRMNQVLQLFAVTNPELKSVFKRPTRPSIFELVKVYPTAAAMAKASEDEIRQTLSKAGAKSVAAKAAGELRKRVSATWSLDTPYLVARQTWLIQDAQRIRAGLESLDQQITALIHGDSSRDILEHPYARILFSLPVVSNIWACTLIGVIGNIDRFGNEHQFRKYLGFSAQNAQSGTSLHTTRLSYDGVRDSRRVLFQMALVLNTPHSQPNVFNEFYKRLVAGRPDIGRPPMPKMKAMGHLCGKISQVLYGCLKSGQTYDARLHASACKIPWDDRFIRKPKAVQAEAFETEAAALAENPDVDAPEEDPK